VGDAPSRTPMSDEDLTRGPGPEDEIELPIDGTLDLHAFLPRDVKPLLRDYIAECSRRGMLEIRIVHGKGTGALRETVHSVLRRLPEVASFRLASGDTGGWGATLVTLDPSRSPP
jgi:dsDNA-specific endonuclease/ATPase MutS2